MPNTGPGVGKMKINHIFHTFNYFLVFRKHTHTRMCIHTDMQTHKYKDRNIV